MNQMGACIKGGTHSEASICQSPALTRREWRELPSSVRHSSVDCGTPVPTRIRQCFHSLPCHTADHHHGQVYVGDRHWGIGLGYEGSKGLECRGHNVMKGRKGRVLKVIRSSTGI